LIAPTLQKLLTFQVPNLMSFFQCLGCTKESVQVQGILKHFVTSNFYSEGLLAPCPTPKLEDHPLSALCNCLIYSQLPSISGDLPSIHNLRTHHAVVTRDPPNISLHIHKILHVTAEKMILSYIGHIFHHTDKYKKAMHTMR